VNNAPYQKGLSSFATHPDGLQLYLKQLVDFSVHTIPEAMHARTPFVVLGTAGLRLLSDSQLADVLERTCSILKRTSPFSITDTCQDIQVIPGSAEGVFGWLAVNYLEGRLSKARDDKDASDGQEATVGFVDVGGASAQLVYAVDQKEIAAQYSNAEIVPLSLSSESTENAWNLYHVDLSWFKDVCDCCSSCFCFLLHAVSFLDKTIARVPPVLGIASRHGFQCRNVATQ